MTHFGFKRDGRRYESSRRFVSDLALRGSGGDGTVQQTAASKEESELVGDG